MNSNLGSVVPLAIFEENVTLSHVGNVIQIREIDLGALPCVSVFRKVNFFELEVITEVSPLVEEGVGVEVCVESYSSIDAAAKDHKCCKDGDGLCGLGNQNL